jgi:hypothetical protein
VETTPRVDVGAPSTTRTEIVETTGCGCIVPRRATGNAAALSLAAAAVLATARRRRRC